MSTADAPERAEALIIVGIGSVVGAAAGLIPMWGITMASEYTGNQKLSMSDTPWPWLALLAVGLPLGIAVVSWLVPSRHPDLTSTLTSPDAQRSPDCFGTGTTINEFSTDREISVPRRAQPTPIVVDVSSIGADSLAH